MPPRKPAARSAPRSAQTIIRDAAGRLAALDAAAAPAGDDGALDDADAAASNDAARPTGERAGRAAARLRSDLQRDLRETDALLEALALDVRVALTVIKGRAQLLRRQAFATGAPDRRQIRSVEEIDRAVSQIDRLLRDRMVGPHAGDGSSPGERPSAES